MGNDINLWLNNSKIKNKKSTYSNYQYIFNSRIIPNFANVKITLERYVHPNYKNKVVMMNQLRPLFLERWLFFS